MTLLACGLNYKTAPIQLREKTSLSHARLDTALGELLKMQPVNQALILSTCNRNELYLDDADPDAVINWLADYHELPVDALRPHLYFYHDYDAVKHLMRVASGLDSMALGESEIVGQIKQAMAYSKKNGALGRQFQYLFDSVFETSKQIRHQTQIGAHPISIAYVAVNLAKRIFADISRCGVLLVGAGQTINLVATHLYQQGCRDMIIANRSFEAAKQLAQRVNGRAIGLADIPLYLSQADMIFSATDSPTPIIGKGALATAVKSRKHRPMYVVDLAMPRDIEPEAAELDDIYLYNIDNLKHIVDENSANRKVAAEQAEEMVALQAQHFIHELQTLEYGGLIKSYRQQIDGLKNQQLKLARQRLADGQDPEQVLQEFARSLTNKLMHQPSAKLKQAAYDGRVDLLLLARHLFDL